MKLASHLALWSPEHPAWRVDATEHGARIVLAGDWTVRTAGRIEGEVDALGRALASASALHAPAVEVVFDEVGVMDTAGALLLQRILATVPGERLALVGVGTAQRVLLDEVAQADLTPPPAPAKLEPWRAFLTDLGRYGVGLWHEAQAVLALLGGVASVAAVALVRPSRIRFIPFVHQLQRTALDAAPIIMLMSFLIGGIIAQQGAFYFRRFGADLYVVDMVGVLTLREIAVLLTAIMVAGRSGSAITAELGSMKMREEIDALKVTGLDPIEMLVVPRLSALMLALPILTFIADLAAIFGAAVVCNVYGDIPTETFLHRLKAAVEMRTFLVGVAKAPFMALLIGLVAAVEGLQVKGSAESLGEQTTLSVVKSIFMVIVVDGIFAMFYASIGV